MNHNIVKEVQPQKDNCQVQKIIIKSDEKSVLVNINNDKLFRCHKGYIINADFVNEIVPWGKKTFLVKMAYTKKILCINHINKTFRSKKSPF